MLRYFLAAKPIPPDDDDDEDDDPPWAKVS
jgi:hypothetical protein